jgi:hypothetical protein
VVSTGWYMLLLIAMPMAVTLFFSAFAIKPEWLAFTCRRCDTTFRRKAHRGFPAACPRCGARDWSV